MAEALHFLRGARLQRLDVPAPGVLALTLYVSGQRHHLLAPFDGRGLPRLLPERPTGDAAGGLAQRLRKWLTGSRLVEASWRGQPDRADGLLLHFEGAKPAALYVGLSARAANLVCLDAAGRAVITADAAKLRALGGALGKPLPVPPPLPAPPFADQPAAWREVGDGSEARAPVDSPEQRARKAALRALSRRRKALVRKRSAIGADLARAAEAEPLREAAEWLLCHLDRVPPGASEVTLPPRDPHATALPMRLDPALSALANAELWFKKARRFERGKPIAERRASEVDAELSSLDDRVLALKDPGVDVSALLGSESSGRSPLASPREAQGAARAARLPYRSFESEAGFRVLVGRSATDNDTLTLRHAKPHDLWLHVRDSPGAHVVVPVARGGSCPDRVRLDAALLAAHFSPMAREKHVDVSVCERRYVRKQRGSAPGSVQVDRERVLGLRMDEARVRWLLEREQRR